jgi:hypothetical protein
MKEHPILFSGDMVKAILEGRKTQTRRIIKPQPELKTYPHLDNVYSEELQKFITRPNINLIWKGVQTHIDEFNQRCPYGKVGDQLWVRETWAKVYCEEENEDETFVYRATDPGLTTGDEDEEGNIFKWRPSIFMPRYASRIQFEIVNIAVDRLNNISEEDARAEGIEMNNKPYAGWFWMENIYSTDYAPLAYEKLWDKINGKDSWLKNPWVWVIEFKRIN